MTELTELVGSWMGRQRWYSTKGVEPRLRLLASVELDSNQPGARVLTHFFADDGPRIPRVYQVPVVAKTGRDGDASALIGEAGGSYLYDGTADLVYVSALAAMMAGGGSAEAAGVAIRGHRLGSPVTVRSSRRMTGEQSNTSIVGELDDGGLVLIKVFRVVQDGANPDVSTLAALTEGGSERTPALRGWVSGSWPDATGLRRASGELALAQDFLSGAEDGWELAVAAAEVGDDFTGRAVTLGAGTAELHAQLARVLPTKPAASDDVALALDGMFRRLAIASAEVPDIAESRSAITAVYEAAADPAQLVLQRIHGDLHLGQVLFSAERGWQFIDFEGEPLRPLGERAIPDATLRDVAGMLRSFDYVAGSLARREPPIDAAAWAVRARSSYLEGYSSVAGSVVTDFAALLDAFELDKAVYEVTYEARHRPAWLPIPLAAVERLLSTRVV